MPDYNLYSGTLKPYSCRVPCAHDSRSSTAAFARVVQRISTPHAARRAAVDAHSHVYTLQLYTGQGLPPSPTQPALTAYVPDVAGLEPDVLI